MIIIVSKIIFILSLFGILFIVIRKLPALSRLPEESFVKRFSFKAIFAWPRNIIKQFISSGFFQNVIIGGLEKSLRRFKIMTLKINNIVDKFLRKIKRNSGE